MLVPAPSSSCCPDQAPQEIHLYQALFGPEARNGAIFSNPEGPDLARSMAEAVVMRSLGRDVSLALGCFRPARDGIQEASADCMPDLGQVWYRLPDVTIFVTFLLGV